ncbi:MAG: hypothetical protein ACRC03_14410 [Romboutsia sp.]
MEMKKMQTKCTYLFNNIEYSIISKNDIDLRIGKKKIDNFVKEKESMLNSIEEILLSPDSKKIVYFYNEDITKEQEPIDFLNEVHSKFSNYKVFMNMNIHENSNEYILLNERYKDLADFFEEHNEVSLAINGTIVEAKEEENVTIFVSI